MNKDYRAGLVWNLTFGIEDSLVSTVGLLSGVAIGGMDRARLMLVGVVLIFVEAFSMGVGSFIADQAKKEMEDGKKVSLLISVPGAMVMMVSYLLAGLVPLSPYVLFTDESLAWSIGFSTVALFVLGITVGLLGRRNIWREAFKTMMLGGVAIVVGIVAGRVVGIR